jgi:transposase/DNA-binding CsgD family transcriptional regulator
MANKRITNIQEDLSTLKSLEREYAGSSNASRIKFLHLLKANPAHPFDLLAEKVGTSLSTIQRWRTLYEEGGLDALLGLKKMRGRQKRMSHAAQRQLGDEFARGELETLKDVQDWLCSELGLAYSISGVRNLLHSNPELQRKWERRVRPSSSAHSVESLACFVNQLPSAFDVVEWINEFRIILQRFLGDVDRISVDVNCGCNLLDPQSYAPSLLMMQNVETRVANVSVVRRDIEGSFSEQLLRNFREHDFPFDDYHPPHSIEFYLADRAHLGTIILWRDRHKSPISRATIEVLELLEPFLRFILTDVVMRHHYAHPADRVFHDVVDEMVADAGLTMQERRILILRLLGDSCKVIACKLGISQNAVRKHITSVHRKTGTQSSIELFARYFTPRISRTLSVR